MTQVIIFETHFFKHQSIYNTNLSIWRHSGNAILRHFSFGVKVGKTIPYFCVHGFIDRSKTFVYSCTTLFGQQSIEIFVFV